MSGLIDRDLAIMNVRDIHFHSNFREYSVLDEVMTMLYQMQDAEPEPQWIPCSERLPENNRQVLVYARSVHFALAKYDEMRNANGIYEMQWVTFDAWKPFYKIKEVIAWMPLPEPYKERWEK